MHQVLRDHAVMLRSQADELDAIADALVQMQISVDTGYHPITTPVSPLIFDPDDVPQSDAITVAVPDGHVDVTYMLHDLNHVNEEATLRMAKHDALQGKIVRLDYGDTNRDTIWTKETFT